MSDTNIGLTAPVKDGVVNYVPSPETSEPTKRGSSDLGKDAFLQLLICQMQNQDPLDPSSNTEYVAQLAQFSQLEQLQNLSGESEKSQAFSLVGKHVIFQITDTNGKTAYPEGTVDFINMSGKKIQLSVNGTVYDYDDLYKVVNDEYYISESIPKIDSEYNFTYNAKSPENINFTVDFGRNEFKGTEVAVVVGGVALDRQYIRTRENVVTIDKQALKDFANGDYAVSVVFNNSIYTTVNDKITVSVFNSEEGDAPTAGDAESES